MYECTAGSKLNFHSNFKISRSSVTNGALPLYPTENVRISMFKSMVQVRLCFRWQRHVETEVQVWISSSGPGKLMLRQSEKNAEYCISLGPPVTAVYPGGGLGEQISLE